MHEVETNLGTKPGLNREAGFVKFCRGALGWLVLAVLAGLTLANFYTTAYFKLEGMDAPHEKIFFRPDLWPVAIGAACLAAVWAALFQAKENRNSARIWWRVLLVLGLLGAAWLVVSGVELRADSLKMSQIAQRWIQGDYSDFDTGEYLFCYPYQLGYGLLLEGVYRLFGAGNFQVVEWLNLACILASFWMLGAFARMLLPQDSEGSGLTAVVAAGAVCAVFYTVFVYGNVPGMTFAFAGLYFQLRWQRGGKAGWMLLSGVCTALSIWLKTFGLIFLVAQIILLILHAARQRRPGMLAWVLVLLVCWQGLDKGAQAWMSGRIGHEMNQGGPMVLTIAMGMQMPEEGTMAEGWFNNYNQDTYRTADYDSELASERGRQAIADRLEEFADDPQMALEFYKNKTLSQWSEPTYESLWLSFPMDSVWQDEPLTAFQKAVYQGGLNLLLEGWMDLYQSLVWLWATIYVAARRKKLEVPQLAPGLVILGGFLFQLLWEAKSQYTMVYFLMAIPYASGGLAITGQWVQGLLGGRRPRRPKAGGASTPPPSASGQRRVRTESAYR